MWTLRCFQRAFQRSVQMARSRYCLLGVLILMLVCWGDTLAQWRTTQRPLRMNYDLTIREAATIASFTNIRRFRELLKPILVPRIVNTPQHRQVGEYLFKTLEDAGFHTEWDEFVDQTPFGSNQFRNIIATFDPHAPRRLVLACHYDSKIIKGSVFIGAVDSAVPCAMMLDFAQTLGPLLRSHPNLPVTLQLVFLDGEEAFVEWSRTDSTYGRAASGGQMGAAMELDRIDAFVLLDLLGAPNPQIAHSIGHGTRPLFVGLENIEKNLRTAGKLRPIPQIFSGLDSWRAVEDDHIPFMERGVPIMHLIPVPFPTVWHTPSDNEKALDNRTIFNLLSILRVFTAEYLGLKPTTFTE
ncbi:Glutaminyl-peptide cyclotransferase [Aphelenchoides fujianensis]|nr:Glutaminyl-peptide cyclotransferase [Aphelenchoides fujianensis]